MSARDFGTADLARMTVPELEEVGLALSHALAGLSDRQSDDARLTWGRLQIVRAEIASRRGQTHEEQGCYE